MRKTFKNEQNERNLILVQNNISIRKTHKKLPIKENSILVQIK
jgi:hypothetical protein